MSNDIIKETPEFLQNLFIKYFEDFKKLKSDYTDLIYNDFILRISCGCWEIREALFDAMKSLGPSEKITVLYKDSECYHEALRYSKSLGNDIKWISYYQYYTAIYVSASDFRMRSSIETTLSNSDLVVMLNTSDCPDVVLSAVKSKAFNLLCLIE